MIAIVKFGGLDTVSRSFACYLISSAYLNEMLTSSACSNERLPNL